MRTLALAFCAALIFPSALPAQELYFTILDSIDINPRCMTLADFDGDGLEDIFIGLEPTGIAVFNPRTHDIIWQSGNELLQPVFTIGYFDIDGDSSMDIISAVSYLGHLWLKILYGPDFQESGLWGGYISGIPASIETGFIPDSSRIMLTSNYFYSISSDNWDYLCTNRGASSRVNKANGYLAEQYTYTESYYMRTRYWGYIRLLNSDLNLLRVSQTFFAQCDFTSNFYSINYGVVEGNFLTGGDNIFASCIYKSAGTSGDPRGTITACYDDTLGVLYRYIDSDSVSQASSTPWALATDVNDDNITDILAIAYIGGLLRIDVFNGANFHRMGIQNLSLSGFSTPTIKDVLPAFAGDEIVFEARNKIYIAKIGPSQVSIYDSPSRLKPSSFVSSYPNPFNSTTTISFTSDYQTQGELMVINILGQVVARVFSGTIAPGVNSWQWESSRLSSGLYFAVINTNEGLISHKMQVIK